ncbi:MAG: dienelactone hydrolase family protein [Alphaproteobacteria bacterium]|nr:MAG: dienelactone hydrolase family protein [Alphaproteobacteria bacterium]
MNPRLSAVSPTRREVSKGLASLPLATLLGSSALAQEVAASLEEVSLELASGRVVTGALARPEAGPAPTMLIIHEWWGLNDQIKTMAAEFAKQGYLTLACDLYGGVVATTSADAGYTMGQVKSEEASETLVGWADWLKAHEGSTGKIGTCGWCFGGGWSLNASLATPVDATVIYYGNVAKSAEELSALKGPVLGHFGSKDTYINEEMVSGFKTALAEAGKSAEIYTYNADHAFANPTTARYDEEDAALAWERTTRFLKDNLG